MAQQSKDKKSAGIDNYAESNDINIEKELQGLSKPVPGVSYCISLCADVPYNKKPYKVAHHQQTGHVFLILRMIEPATADTTTQVFGFYPKRGLPTLFFKKIKSIIKDNSRREHDAIITKQLTADEFDTVIERSIAFSKHIYHINRFNCYEYALYIFNSVAGKDTVPLTHVRFPFIFGWGGSPAGLYRDLKKMKQNGSPWADAISFGEFIAPQSTTRFLPENGEKNKGKR